VVPLLETPTSPVSLSAIHWPLRNETVDQDIGVVDTGTTVQFVAADAVNTGRVRKVAASAVAIRNPRHESRSMCPLSLVYPVSRSRSTGLPTSSQGFLKSERKLRFQHKLMVGKGLIVRR
jgi:hypothetical protein